jgi:hypothetical protein
MKKYIFQDIFKTKWVKVPHYNLRRIDTQVFMLKYIKS